MTRLLDHLGHRATRLSLIALTFAACGVQEHEQPAEKKLDTRPKIAPPPPSTGGITGGSPATSAGASAGGTSSISGGGPSTLGGTGPTAGGAVGTPTGGAFIGGGAGGVPVTGGGGGGAPSLGGAPSTGGSPPAATGGSSGIFVDINGTMLPKEDVIGFIHIGHSNMAGRTSRPESEKAFFFTDMDLHAWMYKNDRWDPALEPTAGDAENTQFGRLLGGPGTALVKQAVQLAPNKYFVSLGYGRASAYCSQFLPGSVYYGEMMAAPKALKGKITYAAIVVMLGITERHGTADAISQFPQCVNQLVTAIRNDVGEPNLPVLMNDYEMESTGELSPTSDFAKNIIPQIHMVTSVVSNSALIPTEDIGMEDDHHFNLTGYHTWTARILTIMREKGWFPWAK